MKIRRTKSEVSCEFCGRMFTQTRWWQVFCTRLCKKKAEKAALSEVRTLRVEIEKLRKQVKEGQNNVLAHSRGPEPFKYDNENQAIGWEE